MKIGRFSLLLCGAVFNDVSPAACRLWAEPAWLVLHTLSVSHTHSGLAASCCLTASCSLGDSQGKRMRETRLEVAVFSMWEIKAALETSLELEGAGKQTLVCKQRKLHPCLSLSLHVAPLYFNAKCFLNSSWGDYLHIIMWSNEGKGMLCKAIASCPLLLSARAKHISCHLFNSISWCS